MNFMQSSPPGLHFETPYITFYGALPVHKTAKANSPRLARPLRLDYVQRQRDGFPTCPVAAEARRVRCGERHRLRGPFVIHINVSTRPGSSVSSRVVPKA